MPRFGRSLRPGMRSSLRYQMESGAFPVPVLYLKFGENAGDVVADSSPEGNDGTVYGATWIQGKLGPGLSFDGIDDRIEVADDASLKITGNLTVAAWIRPTELVWTDWDEIMDRYDRNDGWNIGARKSTYRTRMSIWNGGSSYFVDTPVMTQDVWALIAMVYDEDEDEELAGYLNGALFDSADATLGDIDEDLFIGSRYNLTKHSKMDLDEVMIWDVSLSALQNQELYDGIG